MFETRLVGTFHKNAVEVVKVYLQENKGRVYVDCRVWLLPRPSEPGSETPTMTGLCLDVELIPELVRLLDQAGRAGRQAGRLEAEN